MRARNSCRAFSGLFLGPGGSGHGGPTLGAQQNGSTGPLIIFSRAQNCPFRYYFRGSDGTFGPKMVEESAQNVLVLVQKLKLDALL